MKNILACLMLVLATPAFAQLTVADNYEPHVPIVAGCNCIVPDNGTVQFMWQVDVGSKAIASEDNKKLYIWAPPGTHNVEAVVAITVFNEMLVWVPDPKDPSDINKAKVKTVKTLVSFDVQRYTKSYTVGKSPGPGPNPPPGPGPGPGPLPPPGPLPDSAFAKEAYSWLKAVPAANYTKEKAIAIADNYASTAAQAVATSGWNLAAFVGATKNLNQQKLSVDDISAWATPFFNPLAQYQQKLFTERNLTTSDTAGIAKIWKETADAIRAAANSISGGFHMIPPMKLPLTAEEPPR